MLHLLLHHLILHHLLLPLLLLLLRVLRELEALMWVVRRGTEVHRRGPPRVLLALMLPLWLWLWLHFTAWRVVPADPVVVVVAFALRRELVLQPQLASSGRLLRDRVGLWHHVRLRRANMLA